MFWFYLRCRARREISGGTVATWPLNLHRTDNETVLVFSGHNQNRHAVNITRIKCEWSRRTQLITKIWSLHSSQQLIPVTFKVVFYMKVDVIFVQCYFLLYSFVSFTETDYTGHIVSLLVVFYLRFFFQRIQEWLSNCTAMFHTNNMESAILRRSTEEPYTLV